MTDLDVYLAAIVGGDPYAFSRWMAGSERVVRESLRSFAAVVDVESVLQESLLRVWQVAPRFERDGRPNGLLRFAIRIARNLAVSEVRHTRTVPVGIPIRCSTPGCPAELLRTVSAPIPDALFESG